MLLEVGPSQRGYVGVSVSRRWEWLRQAALLTRACNARHPQYTTAALSALSGCRMLYWDDRMEGGIRNAPATRRHRL
jgi:hypothetical protein